MAFWNQCKRGFARWRHLPADRRAAVWEALSLLVLVTLLLRVLRFRTAYHLLARIAPQTPTRPVDPIQRDLYIRTLKHAPVGRTCLPRALTFFFLARHAGWRPDLHIGCVRENDTTHAHAWTRLGAVTVPPCSCGETPITPFTGRLQDFL